MTPSEKAKSFGCNSLAQVSKITKQSPQTLINWSRDKPELFDVVCRGVGIMTDYGQLNLNKKG